MRNAFAKEITELAEKHRDLVLLSGDIGNRLFDPFKSKFGDRFFNCGVAEANMTSVAAGLAMSGLRPITYTITSFNTTRCFEQIRVDVGYHHLPVIIVGVGGGLSYAGLGGTHHSCEDIALLRSVPGMRVLCPGDPKEVRACLRAAVEDRSGPIYIRIGKKGEPEVHSDIPSLKIGKALKLKDGNKIAILSTGNVLKLALDVCEKLSSQGKSTSLYSYPTVKPLDEDALLEAFQARTVVTLEEHSAIGGLGSAVAEWIADRGLNGRAKLVRINTGDQFWHKTGEQSDAREDLGLSVDRITEKVLKGK